MLRTHWTLATVVNFCTLLVGLTIGFLLGTWHSETNSVHAQQKQGIEEITPIMTVGSAGIGTILAGRIATDQIMVQGIDLIKLYENTLNLLREKGVVTALELNAVVQRSRPEKILRMKPREETTPEGEKKP